MITTRTIRYKVVRVHDAVVPMPHRTMQKLAGEIDALIINYLDAYYLMSCHDLAAAKYAADTYQGFVTLGRTSNVRENNTLSVYSLPRIDPQIVYSLLLPVHSKYLIDDIEDLWEADCEADSDTDDDPTNPT